VIDASVKQSEPSTDDDLESETGEVEETGAEEMGTVSPIVHFLGFRGRSEA